LKIIRAFEFIANWFKHFLYDRKDKRDPFSNYQLSQIFVKFINSEEHVNLIAEDFNRMFFLFMKFLFQNTETKAIGSELNVMIFEGVHENRTFLDFMRTVDCIKDSMKQVNEENKIIFE